MIRTDIKAQVSAAKTRISPPRRKLSPASPMPTMHSTPMVANSKEIALRAVIASFSRILAKMTINAGVAEVMTDPIWAEDKCVPANWAQIDRK